MGLRSHFQDGRVADRTARLPSAIGPMGLGPGLVFLLVLDSSTGLPLIKCFRKANRRLPQGVEVAGVESLGEEITVFQDALDGPRLGGDLPDQVHRDHQDHRDHRDHDHPPVEPVGVLLG